MENEEYILKLTVSREGRDMIGWLVTEMGGDFGAVARVSFGLLRWAIQQQNSGRRVVSVDEDGEEVGVLPLLSGLAARAIEDTEGAST